MTAKKSIKAYCRWCCCGSDSEVTVCPIEECPLYEFRKGATIKGVSKQKAIRDRCHECMQTIQSSKCKQTDCDLWPYRDGHRPNEETLTIVRQVQHKRVIRARASG